MNYALKHLAEVIGTDSPRGDKDKGNIATGISELKSSGELSNFNEDILNTNCSQCRENTIYNLSGSGTSSTASNQKSSESIDMRIPVPWGHVAAKTWGSSKGYPVLCVHGWMDNAASFDTLIPFLPKSMYFVCVDLPGHGFSSYLPPGSPYTNIDYIMSLRRVVNHFQWKRFSLIGHSMGAGLGSFYSSVYPFEVDRLVMLDTIKMVTGDLSAGYASKIGTGTDEILAMEKLLSPNPPTYSYEEAVSRIMEATGDAVTEKSAKILMSRGAREVSKDKWAFTRDIRLRNLFTVTVNVTHKQYFTIIKEMRCALLIVKALDGWGEKREISDEALKIFKAQCKSFHYVEVPEGGHFLHLNEPEKIADLINAFLLHQNSSL